MVNVESGVVAAREVDRVGTNLTNVVTRASSASRTSRLGRRRTPTPCWDSSRTYAGSCCMAAGQLPHCVRSAGDGGVSGCSDASDQHLFSLNVATGALTERHRFELLRRAERDPAGGQLLHYDFGNDELCQMPAPEDGTGGSGCYSSIDSSDFAWAPDGDWAALDCRERCTSTGRRLPVEATSPVQISICFRGRRTANTS